MKTYMTVSELMKELHIRPSKYNNLKMWCYKHKDELDTKDCKWNHGFYAYNVILVREKCPYKAWVATDKVSAPEHIETPLDAAERLAAAINTATGKNLTGAEVMEHCNRMYDYIRMRRTMARVLWRMRKERRVCNKNRNACLMYRRNCYSSYGAFDTRMKKLEALESKENIAAHAAVVTMILFILVSIAFLTHVFCS